MRVVHVFVHCVYKSSHSWEVSVNCSLQEGYRRCSIYIFSVRFKSIRNKKEIFISKTDLKWNFEYSLYERLWEDCWVNSAKRMIFYPIFLIHLFQICVTISTINRQLSVFFYPHSSKIVKIYFFKYTRGSSIIFVLSNFSRFTKFLISTRMLHITLLLPYGQFISSSYFLPRTSSNTEVNYPSVFRKLWA